MKELDNIKDSLLVQLLLGSKDSLIDEVRKVVREVVQEELKNLLSDSLKQNDRLTYSQISKEYKISVKTLGKYKKIGLLIPVCKGGKTLLFDRLEVEEVLRTRPRIKSTFLKKVA